MWIVSINCLCHNKLIHRNQMGGAALEVLLPRIWVKEILSDLRLKILFKNKTLIIWRVLLTFSAWSVCKHCLLKGQVAYLMRFIGLIRSRSPSSYHTWFSRSVQVNHRNKQMRQSINPERSINFNCCVRCDGRGHTGQDIWWAFLEIASFEASSMQSSIEKSQ